MSSFVPPEQNFAPFPEGVGHIPDQHKIAIAWGQGKTCVVIIEIVPRNKHTPAAHVCYLDLSRLLSNLIGITSKREVCHLDNKSFYERFGRL